MKNAYCTLNTIWHKATADSRKVTVGSKRLSMHVISIVLLKLVSYPEQKITLPYYGIRCDATSSDALLNVDNFCN